MAPVAFIHWKRSLIWKLFDLNINKELPLRSYNEITLKRDNVAEHFLCLIENESLGLRWVGPVREF